jgi:hypothetical protein
VYAYERACPGDHVVVLGADWALRWRRGTDGVVTVADGRARSRDHTAVPDAVTVACDARDAVATASELRDRGLLLYPTSRWRARARLVRAPRLSPRAPGLCCSSTATSFSRAAFGSDPLGTAARLSLSNGVTP